MGELGAFLKIERHGVKYSDPAQRANDFKEFLVQRSDSELGEQGARCMECGVPFCHNGCPLGNLIPDWNDLVYRQRWEDAIVQLHATNNFPEFTGRLCPAPCEAACVLEIREGDAVTIKQIENSIIDRAWQEGWVKPLPPKRESGRSVGVVGAGPAGMAAAQQLRRAGHQVVLYERDEAVGGLIRFGVPDFKIEKHLIERRMDQLLEEGVVLRAGVDVGQDITAEELRAAHDAIVISTGSRVPRNLDVPGRELEGIHFAMDFLYDRNRWVATQTGTPTAVAAPGLQGYTAEGKHVVVIGGGDTGADCVGNSIRQGAASVAQLEVMPEPPPRRNDDRTPWPLWPQKFRLSYAMEEAKAIERGEQDFSVVTTHFEGDADGHVRELHYQRGNPEDPFGPPLEGTEGALKADLVLLAMGFLHPEPGLLDALGVQKDPRGNAKAVRPYTTSAEGVFAAGDARRGQSLIVWAINEGRQCARMVDRYLGSLEVEVPGGGESDADTGPEGPPRHPAGSSVTA